MSTELILIRHGNAVRVHGDYVHAPLTSLGQEQAAQTGAYFSAAENKLDGLYSSPLLRTQQTAKIISAKIGMEAKLEAGVQEIMAIELPVLVLLEILSILDPVEDYLDARVGVPIHWPIEGRVSRVLIELLARHPNQRVAVVAHSGVISAALSWYLPEKRWRWWRTTVSNCSLTRFKVDGAHAELVAVNDIKHLSPAITSNQPPTPTVEISKEAHPVEKALVFEKPPEPQD